jgi:hypothetical protein
VAAHLSHSCYIHSFISFPSCKWQYQILLTLRSKLKTKLFWLTNVMEQNPSWEASSRSTNLEIIRILWNLEVHYRVHKSPPLDPILSYTKPVHTITFYCLHMLHVCSLNVLFPLGSPTKIHNKLFSKQKVKLCVFFIRFPFLCPGCQSSVQISSRFISISPLYSFSVYSFSVSESSYRLY